MAQTYNNAEIRITYQVQGITHRMNLGCLFSGSYTIGTDPSLVTKNSTTVTANAGVNDLIDLVATQYDTSVSFSSFEVWDIDQIATAPTFVYGQTIGGIGGSTTGIALGWQMTMLYRATTGKVGRIQMMESIDDIYGIVSRPFGPNLEALAVYVESDLSWIYHSSNGFVATVYSVQKTTNNALERKRYGVS